MKDNVTSLDKAIVANSGSIAENTDTITDVSLALSDVNTKVEGNTGQITDMTENVDNLETMFEDYIHNQEINSVRGRWCAFKGSWKTDHSIIKYDRLTFEDTNMDTTHTGTPLNIDTGNCWGKLSTKYFFAHSKVSGVFTVPKSGVWRVYYSLRVIRCYFYVKSASTVAPKTFINCVNP